jgi:hypothetical protein
MLQDMAVLTGAKPVFEDLGVKIDNITVNDLGAAKKVRIDKDTPPSSKGRARAPTSRVASSRSRPRSKAPPAITIARSSRSAWPSCPVGSPRSTSAPRPKPR